MRLVESLRIVGAHPRGELGFRFGPPRDVDGDGAADIAAGARFTDFDRTQMGHVGVWTTATGTSLAEWPGRTVDALFGHATLTGPDVDGDGLADVVASAPTGRVDGEYRGVVTALSPRSGDELWRRVGPEGEPLGWHMVLAGDQDGDSVEDILAGAPRTGERSRAHLLSGADGAVIRSYASPEEDDLFGWHVAVVGDVDGDGRRDFAIGAPSARGSNGSGAPVGAVHVVSSRDGATLRTWRGRHPGGDFGQVVCALGDLDHDGVEDIGIGAPRRNSPVETGPLAGEVIVVSTRSGELLHRWVDDEPGALFGRMVSMAPDIDGDGLRDVAIGAPWSGRSGRERAGRFEVRSSRSGEVLANVRGDRPDAWLGWHIEVGDELGRDRRPGLLVSALREPGEDDADAPGTGVLRVYVVLP